MGLGPGLPDAQRGDGLAEVGDWITNKGQVGANHFAMMSRPRRFVDGVSEQSAPLVVLWGCPIRLHYRT
jgi:hypothetical protein